jgi:hypothetical protein
MSDEIRAIFFGRFKQAVRGAAAFSSNRKMKNDIEWR